ncbi:MAG: ATP-binding cassette domain-containing protein [Paludibacter sp.]|nr:ATP-binding cassette domain-containing protein [Paludibacter sp.]
MTFLKNQIPALLAVIAILFLWQIFSWSMGYPAIFPSLPVLFTRIIAIFLTHEFYIAISLTILRGLIGFLISFVLAFTFSTIAVFSPFWKSFFHPLVVFTRSIPVISLVLIALLWFSPDNLPVFIAFLTMFPILYQNILNGLELTDKKLIDMSKVFGKSSIIRFTSIYLPSAKSVIFGGISSAMGFGWRAVIIGEVLAQPLHGIGTNMKQAQSYINISELIAWTAVAIAVSYLFDYMFRKISHFNLMHHFNKHFWTTNKKVISNNEVKIVEIREITKHFNQNRIFSSYAEVFTSDKVYCIKGLSGKGKSTLLNLISEIEMPDNGKITHKNINSFAYSFQDLRLIPWLTVEENILYVLNKHKINRDEVFSLINQLLNKTELTEHVHKLPNELSGGQKQRVSLVRAMITKSDLLLLDEPLNGLDAELKLKIIEVLDEWISTYKPLVIWATHEEIMLEKSEIKNVYI